MLGRGNLAINKHPIQGGGVVILLVASCNYETRISSGWLHLLSTVQNFFYGGETAIFRLVNYEFKGVICIYDTYMYVQIRHTIDSPRVTD